MKKIVLFCIVVMPWLPVSGQTLKTYEQEIPGTALTVKMIAIPAGSFSMGSAPIQRNREKDESPQKTVALDAFWLEEHEVTFAEWDAFFKNMEVPQTKAITVDAVSRPTAQYIDLTWGMGRDSKNPANSMSQQAGIMYCKWLYEKTGIFFRLPTEAEWEYACKAGVENNDQPISEVAYFKDNSGGKYHKIMERKPNAWGLYDMLGNLSEWTLDQYDANIYDKMEAGVKNPTVPPASKYPRVARGGSFVDEGKEIRCTNRIPSSAEWNKRDPQIPKSRWWLTDGMYMGFRIVRPAVSPAKSEIDKFYASYLK